MKLYCDDCGHTYKHIKPTSIKETVGYRNRGQDVFYIKYYECQECGNNIVIECEKIK